eukprot:7374716-Lingulodinium_polyedra.AAC.1
MVKGLAPVEGRSGNEAPRRLGLLQFDSELPRQLLRPAEGSAAPRLNPRGHVPGPPGGPHPVSHGEEPDGPALHR